MNYDFFCVLTSVESYVATRVVSRDKNFFVLAIDDVEATIARVVSRDDFFCTNNRSLRGSCYFTRDRNFFGTNNM
jgi:hypothetical protein